MYVTLPEAFTPSADPESGAGAGFTAGNLALQCEQIWLVSGFSYPHSRHTRMAAMAVDTNRKTAVKNTPLSFKRLLTLYDHNKTAAKRVVMI
jgi:hypothetical protein